MSKVSKNRKIILGVFFGILGLMCLHPMGRMIIKLILPLGTSVPNVVGTGLFILFLMFMFFPQISDKWKRRRKKTKERKSTTVSTFISDKISRFIYDLVKKDKDNEYVPYFIKVIDVGEKRNEKRLVENFLDYYGQLTIKLLDSQSDLSDHNTSEKINNTLRNISKALEEIKQICDNFVARLVDDDVLDINADITVLGQVSVLENLK